MGTRNLVIVKSEKKVRVAQYGQWDGYPTGQGITIAEFLQKLKLPEFKKNLKKVRWAKPAEIKQRWVECGADPDSDMVTMDIADKHKKKYPWLSRDTGAGVLELIQKGKVDILNNEIDFLKDGLFCEFAYEIDLDKKTVRVFTHHRTGKKTKDGGNEYKCKPFKTYKFKDFTVEEMERLEKEMNKE